VGRSVRERIVGIGVVDLAEDPYEEKE